VLLYPFVVLIDSRIPEIKNGTALEDALRRCGFMHYVLFFLVRSLVILYVSTYIALPMLVSSSICIYLHIHLLYVYITIRRDFTVNALFYNLNTRAVEDLTGRGLEDLHSGTRLFIVRQITLCST
jgi:hypothetical protein